MITDEEKQVRLQFLDEAQEYIEKLESGLLGLSNKQIIAKQLEPVLRAAHSIKGGAAMMGFTVLSELAHRLEDFFKVLQYGRDVKIDATIETNLLAAVDRLSQITRYLKQGQTIEEQWLTTNVEPILAFLLERLGTPNAEDEANLLADENGEDLVSLLFNTEVDQALEKLEKLVQTPQEANLKTELQITAEELAGLGEMLEIPTFAELCQEVLAAINQSTITIIDLTNLAIAAWRQSQALILAKQTDYLPNVLDSWNYQPSLDDETIHDITIDRSNWLFDDDQAIDRSNILPISYLDQRELPEDSTLVPLDKIPERLDTEEIKTIAAFLDQPSADLFHPTPSIELPDLITPEANFSEDASELFAALEQLPVTENSSVDISKSLSQEASALFAALAETPEPLSNQHNHHNQQQLTPATPTPIPVDQTIRVSVRQLDLLGDLFGELVIERNGLNIQLKNLRQLLTKLNNKVKQLEESNYQLRQNYDSKAAGRHRESHSLNAPKILNQIYPKKSNFTNDLQWLLEDQEQNNLLSQFDILEFDHYDDNHLLSQEVMDNIVQIQELSTDLDLNLTDTERLSRDMHRTADLMQTGLMQVRMRPLSEIFQRFPRALRDLSHRHQKPVELQIRGGHTLVDRSILEALNDPLLHIIRNAFDHGIESPEIRQKNGKPATGNIEINAFYRGNQTIITIRDDGGGISLEKIKNKAKKLGLDDRDLQNVSETDLLNMIFEPGFSTADQVTDLSGRGVGMDVVRTNLQEINGEVQVQTSLNQGTTFTISVPFNLSIARILLVEIKGILLAVPSNLVEEVLLFDDSQVITTAGQSVLHWEGLIVRLITTENYLTFEGINHQITQETTPMIDQSTILMVANGEELLGIKVDRFWSEEEVTIRQPQHHLKLPIGFVGCTILGDGRVVPLLDPLQLIQQSNNKKSNQLREWQFTNNDEITTSQNPVNSPKTSTHRPLILVVDDSINVRRFVSIVLEKAGYQIEEAKDGQDAADKLQNGLKPHVIISDVEMPRMDGYGLLAFVKSTPLYSKIPVLMLTSRSGDKHRKIAMNLGATGYFCKPFKEQELLETLKQLTRVDG